MPLDFDLNNIESVEFGVGLENGDQSAFVLVPLDADAQDAIEEMARATWTAMVEITEDPPLYDPGEKHAGMEYVHLPLDVDLALRMRELQTAVNMATDANAMSDPGPIVSYFAMMTDTNGKRLTGLRRATHFKGVLKNHLLRFMTDALRIVEDPVFRLDHDFDVLVDSSTVHILRPSAFEFAGKIQRAVLEAVPSAIAAVQADLSFVDLSSIESYASTRPRAARYLASIRSQPLKDINPESLLDLCVRTNVAVTQDGDKLTIDPGSEMAFLEVLDRRRYDLELIDGVPERFKAGSRSRIDA